MTLADFGSLQKRYQSLPLTDRAKAVLADARPALQTAQSILEELAAHDQKKRLFDGLRNNAALTGKMRASEARAALIDPNNDFIDTTLHKLASWRKTMERLADGEGIAKDGKGEYIPGEAPIAAAVVSMGSASGYLAIVQLALTELSKADVRHAGQYKAHIARIRRCSTLISDCESASSINALVH